MLAYIVKLLLTLKTQNCSVSLMLESNKTPILTSTFQALRNEQFEFIPTMLPDPTLNDWFPMTWLSLMQSYVTLGYYMGPISYRGEQVTECFVWMMENVDRVRNKQAILRDAARKKYLVVVGDQYNFVKYGHSPIPVIHLGKFGYIRVYCPTFDDRYWTGKLYHIDQFLLNIDEDMCPLRSYIRYGIQ